MMGKAGYCDLCQTYVWLRQDGGCQNGHPAESVSRSYETDPVRPAPSLAAAVATRPERVHPWLIVSMIAVVVLLASVAATAVFLVVRPLTAAGGEMKARVDRDYPGWKATGMRVYSQGGSGGSQTDYYFTVTPPGRGFSVVIAYGSEDGAPYECWDETLRPSGKHHERSSSLLDYLEQNYVSQDWGEMLVVSYPDGTVFVGCSKDSSGSKPWQWAGYLLTYDAASGMWGPIKP